jgi:hypothetical protein
MNPIKMRDINPNYDGHADAVAFYGELLDWFADQVYPGSWFFVSLYRREEGGFVIVSALERASWETASSAYEAVLIASEKKARALYAQACERMTFASSIDKSLPQLQMQGFSFEACAEGFADALKRLCAA